MKNNESKTSQEKKTMGVQTLSRSNAHSCAHRSLSDVLEKLFEILVSSVRPVRQTRGIMKRKYWSNFYPTKKQFILEISKRGLILPIQRTLINCEVTIGRPRLVWQSVHPHGSAMDECDLSIANLKPLTGTVQIDEHQLASSVYRIADVKDNSRN